MAEAGFFYLASARSQKDFVRFCAAPSRGGSGRQPALRSIAPEIEALEGELLALYRRPPRSTGTREFITSSVDAQGGLRARRLGLRYGALVRYLQAALRVDALRTPPPALEGPALTSRLAELEKKLDAGGRDDSIGRIFLESAQGDVRARRGRQEARDRPAVAGRRPPRYFAALEPAKPRPACAQAAVTVTLVRWPYT
jgi:hypothetical protein